jgi:hypothetical protein
MAPKKPAAATGKEVRAKVAHTQPGTLTYREEGDVFVHEGELYEHVEPSTSAVAPSDEDE